ncbi:EKC/KEOPS complex subunit GON7-like [Hemicordylus capensis]|uniref:EKC/KEOPS complex subunit GON7-like n=1 Tax=Hemicordylus capensis TaxID=884348 RepID=UPI002304AC6A|nr:EKC/KEOPS complex subunit GON7-like [Hemicordylus capensis]
MELRAEFTGRDGQRQPLRVRCEPEAELRGLLSGLAQLREQTTALLSRLVQQESGGGGDRVGSGGDEEDEEEEDEDEEESHINAKACPDGPPLKRTKTHS